MYKAAVRAVPRRVLPTSRALVQNPPSRRFLGTAATTQKSRSWKSSAARWALAIGGIYYYNTSDMFAEEPEASLERLAESIQHVEESTQPTIDTIVEDKRRREVQRIEEERKHEAAAKATLAAAEEEASEGENGLGGLEGEADQQGAFNPETGEINWDCPCLGGMAHGPCGEEFKAAFSCFVYSKEEPKGVECIDKFKGMQDCFRQHPDMYGAELEDDEDELEEELLAREAASSGSLSATPQSESAETTEASQKVEEQIAEKSKPIEPSQQDSSSKTADNVQQVGDKEEEPTAHDATSK